MLLSRLHKTKVDLVRFLQHKKHHDIPYHPFFCEDFFSFLRHKKLGETLSCQVDPETFRRYVFWRKQKYWEVESSPMEREKMPKTNKVWTSQHVLFFVWKMMVFTQNRSLLDMIKKNGFVRNTLCIYHFSFLLFGSWEGHCKINPSSDFWAAKSFPFP